MTLTLGLLRHAKSAWDDPTLDDFDRGLSPRGIKAAPLMGKTMRKLGLRPDLILCSTALRTRATLALVLPELKLPAADVRYDERLYLTPPVTLLDVLADVPADKPAVLMVGHNPGLHALALELTGSGERQARTELATKFPTAALAVLTFEATSWRDVRAGSGRLVQFLTPKGLGD